MTTFRVRLATLRGLGMNDSAGMLLMSGEVLFANDIRYWYERGNYSLDLGDPDQAKLSFKRAVDIGFESSEPVEYSDQSFTRGDREKRELASIFARASYQMGYLMGSDGRLEESTIFSSRAIMADSSLLEAYTNLIISYHMRGIRDSALSTYVTAQTFFAGDKRATDALGLLVEKLGWGNQEN